MTITTNTTENIRKYWITHYSTEMDAVYDVGLRLVMLIFLK